MSYLHERISIGSTDYLLKNIVMTCRKSEDEGETVQSIKKLAAFLCARGASRVTLITDAAEMTHIDLPANPDGSVACLHFSDIEAVHHPKYDYLFDFAGSTDINDAVIPLLAKGSQFFVLAAYAGPYDLDISSLIRSQIDFIGVSFSEL